MRNKRQKLMDLNTAMNASIEIWKRKAQEGPVLDLSDEGFEKYLTLYAEERYVRGRNFYAARADNVRTDVEFKINRRSDVTEDMRLRFKDTFYHIEAVLPLDNEGIYSIIKCYEIKHDDL